MHGVLWIWLFLSAIYAFFHQNPPRSAQTEPSSSTTVVKDHASRPALIPSDRDAAPEPMPHNSLEHQPVAGKSSFHLLGHGDSVLHPSSQPSTQPSSVPSSQPSVAPSSQPTVTPSTQPSVMPSVQPSVQPSIQPSSLPTTQPSVVPSTQPSAEPSAMPSTQPSASPSMQPTMRPSGTS
jgi:hypothetical protein